MKAPEGARKNHTNSGGYVGNQDRVNRSTSDLSKDAPAGPDLKSPRPKAPSALMSVHENRGGHDGTQDRVERGSFPEAHELDTDIMDGGQ